MGLSAHLIHIHWHQPHSIRHISQLVTNEDNLDNSHLLESVIRLTEQRDQHSLEICLIQTLHELIAAQEMQLYEYNGDNRNRELKLVVNAASDQSLVQEPDAIGVKNHLHIRDKGLQACLATQQPVTFPTTRANVVRSIYPVLCKDEIAGFLLVESEHLNEREQDLTTSFLKIYQNYLVLLNDNEHDTLTGLLNRKTFDQRILRIMKSFEESKRAADKHEHCCLAVLDIDHFKEINDQFGHLYGDEVLLLFARIMTDTFRESDLLFRYGGEEFVVVLRDAHLEKGLAVLERFRQSVESYTFPQVGKVTVSIGVVQIKENELPTTLIGCADQALYFAKTHGRNQVCSYEQLLTEGKLTAQEFRSDIELF